MPSSKSIERLQSYIKAYEMFRKKAPELSRDALRKLRQEIDGLLRGGGRFPQKEDPMFAVPDPLADLLVTAFRAVGKAVRQPSQVVRILNRPASRAVLAFLFAIGVGGYSFQRFYISRHGLIGEYYYGTIFDHLSMIRRDNRIDFRWPAGSGPFPERRSDSFSIRWTGYLLVDETGTYELSTMSDDGMRLYVDGALIIDDWKEHSPEASFATLQLTQGPHALVAEYFQGVGLGLAQLYWRNANEEKKKIIGLSHLAPPEKSQR